MQDRIEELETRLARAEAVLASLTRHLAVSPDEGVSVTGPFRVVDSSGKTMLEVDLGLNGPTLRLLNAAGDTAVVLDMIATGGSVGICGPGGKTVGLLFADETGGDFVLYDQDGAVSGGLP